MKVKELLERLEKENPNDDIHIIVSHCKEGGSIDFPNPFNHYSCIDFVNDNYEYYVDIDNEVNTEDELIEKIDEENEIDLSWTKKEIENTINIRMKKQKKIKGLWITIEA
jgi:hypothetical protein